MRQVSVEATGCMACLIVAVLSGLLVLGAACLALSFLSWVLP